jgi:uncharacterized protein (TIGR03435 family)
VNLLPCSLPETVQEEPGFDLSLSSVLTVVHPIRFGLLLTVGCSGVWAQADVRPIFAAISIRPLLRNEAGTVRVTGPQRFSMSQTAKAVVQWAYEVEPYQIIGGPDWFDSQRFQILATAAGGTDLKQIRLMAQSLMSDRFQMKAHKETREVTTYALIIAKKGPRLKEAEKAEVTPTPALGAYATGNSIGTGSTGADLGELAKTLTFLVGRPVIDKTGLSGKYLLKVSFDGSSTSGFHSDIVDDSKPSIYSALEDQLGLKLHAQRLPIECLIIDSIERPSDN